MWTSFPTTYSEIVSLYNLVNIICNESGTKEFYRGSVGKFELVDISQLNWFIELGVNDTLLMLDRMKKNMIEGDDSNISINGVVNPLSITLENLKDWGMDLPLEGNMENITTVMKNYETFMNDIQQKDLFYAVFKLFQIKKDEETVINGYISVATNCDTILPVDPKAEFYFGANRYDTNRSVVNEFKSLFSGNSVFLATGLDFPDSLAGSALAGKSNSPIVFVTKTVDQATKQITNDLNKANLTALGGEGVVSTSVINELNK